MGSTPGWPRHACLDDAVEAWRRDRDESAYLTVAALASLGCSRGGNDDDAAMAAVVLLQDGIARLASDLRDLCELDDVLSAVWEEVKRAEPDLGHRAPRFLLQRAKKWILAPAHGFATASEVVPMGDVAAGRTLGEALPAARVDAARTEGPHGPASGVWVDSLEPADDPCADLADLLAWARGAGVLDQADVDLIVELMAVSRETAGREEAYRVVGERHGVSMRTVRRRRDAVVGRLRGAVGEYLADVS